MRSRRSRLSECGRIWSSRLERCVGEERGGLTVARSGRERETETERERDGESVWWSVWRENERGVASGRPWEDWTMGGDGDGGQWSAARCWTGSRLAELLRSTTVVVEEELEGWRCVDARRRLRPCDRGTANGAGRRLARWLRWLSESGARAGLLVREGKGREGKQFHGACRAKAGVVSFQAKSQSLSLLGARVY